MEQILDACRAAAGADGLVIALTGAGVSAESGIPTFRGKEGYWTVGSRDYHPQELATYDAFQAMPWSVWAWYLYRRGVCTRAAPNDGHRALARLGQALGERFALVTQNVDGLHRHAGSPDATMFPIHGDITLMRCAAECTTERWPIPGGVVDPPKGADVDPASKALLVCPRCGGMARPHILWFDECYDEEHYHLDTVRRLASEVELLIVVGTSAQTNLPWQVVTAAERRRAAILDVNIEDNPFGDIARRTAGGVLREPSAIALPRIVEALLTR